MQNNTLSETVPAALRATLAGRDIQKGDFARRIGHDVAWLYRRLTGRTPMTLGELDEMCTELELEPVIEFRPAPKKSTPKKTATAGRSTGRRSDPTPLMEQKGKSR
jgi:DNA-binding Xre family transcriptional regulator